MSNSAPAAPEASRPAETTPSTSPTGNSTPVPSPSPSPKPGTTLGSYKGINLSYGYGINLLKDPKHPVDGSGQYDFEFNGGGIQTWTDNNGDEVTRFAVLTSGQRSDYATCHDNTRYTGSLSVALPLADGSPGTGDVQVGSRICVTTRSGAIGLIQITDAQSSPVSFVAFDLKVWRGEQPTATDSPATG